MLETCATWSMPMNASTSGRSLGNSPRNRCGKQPETINAWPRFCASRTCADSRIVSILSSWAASMNAHVLTITASALAASLTKSRAEAAQRVFGLVDAPGAIAEDQHQQGQRRAERRQRHAPVDLRQLQHDHVEKTAGLIAQRRRFVEFLRLIEFRLQRGQQRRHIEPEQRAIRANESSNVDRRGKGGVVSFLKGADVVGLDLGDLGDLINGEALSLARRAELF